MITNVGQWRFSWFLFLFCFVCCCFFLFFFIFFFWQQPCFHTGHNKGGDGGRRIFLSLRHRLGSSIAGCCLVAQSCLFETPWTVAHQAPLSMGFPGKNIGVGCHFLLQGIFPTQGPASPALADGFWATREAHIMQSQSFIPLFLNTSFTRLDFGPQVIPTWSSRHPKIDSQWEGARDKTQKGRSSQVCEPQLQVKKFALCP